MRIKRNLLFLATLAVLPLAAQTLPNPSYDVQPLYGAGWKGDGGPASGALLDGPSGMVEDSSGNVYVSEQNAGIIRRVKPDGTIDRFAGTGILGYGAAGQQALATNLSSPSVLLIDTDGGLLFYESQYCRIRKVNTDGTVADIAGTGRCGNSLQGITGSSRERKALETDIGSVGGMIVDNQGRLVFSESDRNIVRRIDTDGYIRVIAGTGDTGSTGDSHEAISATFNFPAGLAKDSAGNIYVADGYSCRVRRIDTDGYIWPFAGAGRCAVAADTYVGSSSTPLERINAIAYDTVNHALYIGMPRAYRVVRMDIDNARIGWYLGNGQLGSTTTTDPLALPLNAPTSILVSNQRGILVSSQDSDQVYQVQGGVVNRFAGNWAHPDVGPTCSTAQLMRPRGLSRFPDGSLYISDAGAGMLLRCSDPDTIQGIAGKSFPAGYSRGDGGAALDAVLDQPNRIVRGPFGQIYFSEASRIRYVDTDGTIRTLKSGLSNPSGLAFDSLNRLIYAETGSNKVVQYDLNSQTATTLAGTGTAGRTGDGGVATSATLNGPTDIAYDSHGNLLIADRGNHRIRRLNVDGTIETIAGSGLGLSYADPTGLPARKTGFGDIDGMIIGPDDRIYISESVRVDVIGTDGVVKVITGFLGEDDNGVPSYLDGPLNGADGLSLDASGRLLIAVKRDGRILSATPK